MTTYIGATQAAQLLGVTKPTLYAYVSRGIVDRRTAVDGRRSLYDREQLEALAARTRRRSPVDRPSIDVRIGSAITLLDEDHLTYRGHAVDALAATHTFEQVAELLWTGSLPDGPVAWAADRDGVARCQAVVGASGCRDPLVALALCATTLADRSPADPAASGRLLLAVVPTVLGGPRRGSIAARLTRAWSRAPTPELEDAIARALVLLADHELATSTLAVRVAASVRADPLAAVAAGLSVVRGPLHGAASRAAAALLAEAAEVGAATAVARRLAARDRLPGFGHSVYRAGDPRFAPLLAAVRRLPAPERMDVVDSVLVAAGRAIGHPPNVDLALGALAFVAGMRHDVPIFGVARIAGWIAHYAEELGERPVRYRGLAVRPG